MSSKALISGQAGVAVLLHGGRVQSFHLDGPEGLDRRREEISQIFGDCTDVVVVDDIELEAVPTRLELEWAKQRCLALCLLLLDVESHVEARQLAVADIEEFLKVPEIASFLHARLFVAPMPDNADLIGAINRAHSQNATSLVGILEEVGVNQEEIDRCRSSWDALPAQTFRDESIKEGVAFALVQAGAFHRIVTTAAEKRGALLLKILVQPQFQQWRVGLTTWINSLSSRNRATNRAVDEEEQKGSRRRRPVKQARIPADTQLDVVNRQKDAIRKALAARDLDRARAFCVDLLAYQERNGRPEHTAKSFCDLAQSAKELGYHQLQLEWTQKAVDVAPGDGWSLAQLGDAYRCLGQWSSAQEAFALALRHGKVTIARNGQAEVLKGMGRLEDALREYESNVKEFPADVVARNGRAELLKGMGRLEDALREYESIAKDFPQSVFARTGRAEVLKGMGRLEDALQEYESIAKEFPADVVARTGRAEVFKGMGRLEDALREYESIAKEFPQNAVARNGAASICVLRADYELATAWIGPSVDAEPVNWVGLHILGMIRLRTGRTSEAVALFERGLRDGPFEDRRYFRSALAYARVLAHDLHQAASILEDEPSVVSRVLQIHIYGELDQTERARQAYNGVRSNRNPRVIQLTAELVARARLEMRAPARSDQWVLDREFELLLAA